MTIDASELSHRFGFHKATEHTAPIHKEVRALFVGTANEILEVTKPGREQSLALTALQEAAMWTNAAIAMTAPLVTE